MSPFIIFQKKKDGQKKRETSDCYHPMTTTEKTLKTHYEHKMNPPPPILFNDDWSLIEFILRASNLPKLLLRDIVQNMERQHGKILSLQPVVKLELLRSFLKEVTLIDDKYSDPEDQKYGGWDICFHGTLPGNVSSITKHGFRIPKQHGHVSRFRLNWGDGIYCSPFATYSWSYGHRWENTVDEVMLDPEIDAPIFICAAVRGKPFECRPEYSGKYTTLMEGYDSHVARSSQEWIIFNEHRIVPLCLLYLRKLSFPEEPFFNHIRVTVGCGNNVRSQQMTENLIVSSAKNFTCTKSEGNEKVSLIFK